MSELRLLRVATWREIYSRRRAFLVSTALVLTLVIGGLAVGAWATKDDGPLQVAVGVLSGRVHLLEREIEQRLDPEVVLHVTRITDRTEGEGALRHGSIAALVVGPRHVLWGPATPSWVGEAISSAMHSIYLRDTAEDLGLTSTEVTPLLAPIEGETIEAEEPDESVRVLGVTSVILMFLAIIAYGQWIAYGVVEEKANRVAEVILGAISPGQLLTAKIISLGGLGLAQLIVVGTAGFVTAAALTEIVVPPVAGSTLGWLVLWFLLGYAFYGSLYAAAGSLAADTQEAGGIIGPLNLIPGIGYVVGVISFSAGATALFPRVLSMIPMWSPMLMPGRMAQGSVAAWEIGVAIVAMLLSTFLVVRFAAGVYVGGITESTRTVGWKKAFLRGRDLRPKQRVNIA